MIEFLIISDGKFHKLVMFLQVPNFVMYFGHTLINLALADIKSLVLITHFLIINEGISILLLQLIDLGDFPHDSMMHVIPLF